MTETKFTPWRRADSGYYFNIVVDKGVTIQLEKSLNREQLLKNKATADLIYAAPDLYEALKSVVTIHDFNRGMETCIIEKARKALAKARGEL